MRYVFVKDRFESKMIPRFIDESTGVINELSGSVKIWHMKFRELGR